MATVMPLEVTEHGKIRVGLGPEQDPTLRAGRGEDREDLLFTFTNCRPSTDDLAS